MYLGILEVAFEVYEYLHLMEFKLKSEWLRHPKTREEVILWLNWPGYTIPVSLQLSTIQFPLLGHYPIVILST